ncbi:MAG: NAD(P)-binding domain-containing protein [Gammaproteobacteria bacterium]|nr:NAD(P)-binding domain-containing protein [Gammaproteobacteria bacterium]MDH3508728.1 NAD(P)-binding domain-containing protein [Gammaproteobacteria bacterium]
MVRITPVLIAALLAVTGWCSASAETIAVIGTGNVGGALGPRFSELGHDIIYGSRQPQRADVQALVAKTEGNATAMLPAEAAAAADIVVMATKWPDAEVALKSLGDLSGKIILDPNNAVRINAAGMREMDVQTSTAQMIQDWAPNARVVKAFNTLGAPTMADPSSAGGPVTIPIAGNDAGAKAVIASLVTGIGFEVVDMGDISAAHVIEGMLIIRGNAGTMGTPFNYYFRPVPQN